MYVHFKHEHGDSMLHASSLKRGMGYSSKISVYAYKTQQCHNQEDLNLKNTTMKNPEFTLSWITQNLN
jgi:hypothetical protein